MKKFLILLLFSFLFLCGCSKTETNNNKTVISFSSWGSRTECEIIKEIISEYEKNNPNIQIKFIHVPENYFRKLHLLYAAKTAPDVVFLNNTYAPLYIKAGLLEDLSGKFDEEAFFKSSVDSFRYKNKVYAIPRDISNLVIYVNKDIVRHPERIKTLEDLRFYAKKYTNAQHFGLNFEKNPLFWLYYLEYFGGGILSDDGKTIILNKEESLKGLNFYVDMINKDKSIPYEWQMSSMTSAQMFINQKVAMYLSGRWLVPKFRETVTFNWDIIPFPQSDVSKTLTDASGWAVSKSSVHKEQAMDFIKYLSSKEVSAKFTSTGLITPARIETAKSNVFLDKKQRPYHSFIFTDIINNSKPTPVNSAYSKIIDNVTKNIVPLLNGEKTTEEVVNKTFIDNLQKYCDKSSQ